MTERQPSPARNLRVGVITIVSLLIVVGFSFKSCLNSRSKDHGLVEGHELLSVALASGKAHDFAAAEANFREAAAFSVIDHYPAFLIQTTRRLAKKESPSLPPGQSDVVDAIRDNRLQDAFEAAEKLGAPGSRPRSFYERLIRSIQQTRGGPQ